MAVIFSRNILKKHVSLKDADNEQIKIKYLGKIKNLGKDKKSIKKEFFLITCDYNLVQEKIFLKNLKAYYFQ